ncbi:MAG: sigma 54-interacting transcriptional regulator [bacterium]
MNFEIIDKISSTPTCDIYKIISPDIPGTLAFKQFKYPTSDEQIIKRLYLSFSSAKKINHPHCVKILDWFEQDNQFGIIMEYIEGKAISPQHIRDEQGNLNFNLFVDVGLQICEGLKTIHHHNMVHRDLKPSNILVNNNKTVKITDFDFVKIQDFSQTIDYQFLGSVKYSSPEQCVNAKKVDFRSDLYSLGILFFMLLSEEEPFQGQTFTEIAYKHLYNNPPSLNKLVPNIPENFNKMVNKLLSKDPRHRYPAVNSVISILKSTVNIAGITKFNQILLSPPGFIGREQVIKKINGLITNKVEGGNQAIVVQGSIGIGKTKLWEEMGIGFRILQHPLVEYKSTPKSSSYKFFKILINQILTAVENYSDSEKIEIFGTYAWDLTIIEPYLGKKSFMQKINKIPYLDENISESRIFKSINNLIFNFSKSCQKPLVIFIDDVHYHENLTFKWINSFLSMEIQASIILIMTTDNSAVKPELPILRQNKYSPDSKITYIELMPLNLQETRNLILSMLDQNLHIDEDSREEIYQISNGIPLIIIELIQYLYNSGQIEINQNMMSTKQKILQKEHLGGDIENLLLLRFNNLDSKVELFLKIASLLKFSFSSEIIAYLSGQAEREVIDHLETARSQFILEYYQEEACYSFKHQCYKDIFQSMLEKPEKTKLHLKIANYFQNKYKSFHLINRKLQKGNLIDINQHIFKNTDQLYQALERQEIENIAFHFNQAKSKTEAVSYNKIAAEQARNQIMYEQALNYYSICLEYLDPQKDTREVTEIYIAQGELYEFGGDWDKAEQKFSNAQNLSQNTADKKLQADSNFYLAHILRRKGNYSDSLGYYQKVVELCEKTSYVEGLSKALGEMGTIYLNQGNFIKCEQLYQKQLMLAEQTKNNAVLAKALLYNGNLNFYLNKNPEALDYYLKSAEISKEFSSQKIYSLALLNIGNIYAKNSEFDQALKYYDQYFQINKTINNQPGILLYLLNTTNILMVQKNLDQALKNCFKCIKLSQNIGEKEYLVGSLEKAGIIYTLKKEYKQAGNYLNQAYQNVLELGNYVRILKVEQSLNYFYLLTGNYVKTLDLLDKRIHQANQQNNYSLLFNLYIEKAELLFDQGDIKKSQENLELSSNFLDKLPPHQTDTTLQLFRYRLEFLNKPSSSSIEHFSRLADNTDNISEKIEIYYNLIKSITKPLPEIQPYIQKILHLYNQLFRQRILNLKDLHRQQEIAKMINDHKSSDQARSYDRNLLNILVKFLNPQTAFQEFLEFLIKDINADTAQIILINDDKSGDSSKHYIRYLSKQISSDEVDFSTGIMEQVFQIQKTQIILNALEKEALKSNPSIIGKTFLSILATPLKTKDHQILGVLYVDRRDISKGEFMEIDREEVETIAELLGPLLIEQNNNQKLKTQSEIRNLGLFIGNSDSMKNLYEKIKQISDSDLTVYITGETGSGKELVAKALHQLSSRSNQPFIPVNCSAIPGGLAESEFFGHQQGSFSGAKQDQKGKFELANQGTIFLDEIGDLPIDLQAKLLRVIQDQQIWRIGASKPIQIDTRIIVATHKDLEKEVSTGRFREDLYHRLNVLRIDVPSLRDRVEDIPLLAYFFLEKHCKLANRNIPGFTPSALERLNNYHWSGNVRELENVIAKSVVKHKGNNPIDILELQSKDNYLKKISESKNRIVIKSSLRDTLDNIEKQLVNNALEKNDWHITKASQHLKISRVQLYRLIKKYKLVKK